MANFLSKKSLNPINWFRGLGRVIKEPFAGAWQRNLEYVEEDNATFFAIFSCVSLISKDVGKMGIKLKKKRKKVLVDALTPKDLEIVMKKPNKYQTWQQFMEYWTQCLLLRGNAYIFKVRDVFGNVVALHIINPDLVKVEITRNTKNVFYSVNWSEFEDIDGTSIPASEIIHDRINTFHHPLIGVSPIAACAMSSAVGMKLLRNQSHLFTNGGRPGGVLVAPGNLPEEKATKLRQLWDETYSGQNVGRTAILTGGVEYKPITISAADAQVVEQLKLSAEIVCSVFHVPLFKIGLAQAPSKVSDANEIYYSDCIQAIVESRENLLDDGLELEKYGVEAFLDTDALIRMDKSSKIEYLSKAVGGAILSPNEARAELGYEAVKGGESPMIQQQNFSLEAISKRDTKENPFGKDD